MSDSKIVLNFFLADTSISITKHPIDQLNCIPGSQVEFSVSTTLQQLEYQWYCNEKPIDANNPEYAGSTINCLLLHECLLKHQGLYKCVITDETSNMSITSRTARLKLGNHFLDATYWYL